MSQETIESIIALSGYAGIFLLMIANGLASFPSSQILYIICGYFIFTGYFALVPVIISGTLGNTVGNIILYELARAKGLHYITRWKIFPEREVKKVQMAFNKRGAWFLFVGKLLPAIKVFVPIPAGIAQMNRVLYISIIAVSSALWTLPFIAVGYYFGKNAHVFSVYAIVLLIVAFIVVTIFYRYMNSKEILSQVSKENPDR